VKILQKVLGGLLFFDSHCRVGVQIPLQDYKSVHIPVVTWATLVNTDIQHLNGYTPYTTSWANKY